MEAPLYNPNCATEAHDFRNDYPLDNVWPSNTVPGQLFQVYAVHILKDHSSLFADASVQVLGGCSGWLLHKGQLSNRGHGIGII